jgi:hypothetical protein
MNPEKVDELLKLIAAANPHDKEQLLEINTMFWCEQQQVKLLYVDNNCISYVNHDGEEITRWHERLPRFDVTGNRQALKLCRPKGWHTHAVPVVWYSSEGFQGIAFEWLKNINLISPALPTEELAELYVIILATMNSKIF